MKTNLIKTSIALFFLLLFSSGKVFGYHMLLHDHDTQIIECEVCDKALVDQFSPLDNIVQHPEAKEIPEELHKDIIINYSSTLYTTKPFANLFSRPPPSMN